MSSVITSTTFGLAVCCGAWNESIHGANGATTAIIDTIKRITPPQSAKKCRGGYRRAGMASSPRSSGRLLCLLQDKLERHAHGVRNDLDLAGRNDAFIVNGE